MFRKVLIANRGEILARVTRTLTRMGIGSVAVYSDADRFSPPVLAADEAVRIGGASVAESYLDIEAIVEACKRTGAEAVHPGYGFLSERAEFAEALGRAGICFIGPRPEHLRAFGLKHTARDIAARAGVPMLPGSDVIANVETALAEAARIGYPVMLKSSAGGGGIGMVLCEGPEALAEKFVAVGQLAANNFGDARLFLEKYVARARHVEVQIFGDGKGDVIALGTRDCSLQRRNQKVIEETPAPNIAGGTLTRIEAAAVALAASVGYASAGTVEFVYDVTAESFYFLEVNTRLQVEHGVTEAVYGIDLVEWMIRAAAGDFVLPKALSPKGAAIEARVYAEDASADFRPSSGRLTHVRFGRGVRVDSWVETGTEVSPFYDPMLGKLIAIGETRGAAIATLRKAVVETEMIGVETNLAYLAAVLDMPAFRAAEMTTRTLAGLIWQPNTISVLDAGPQSSLQSLPGRRGYWEVGIPPSGPMDARSAALANLLLGNPETACVLECTFSGPTLRFHCETMIVLTGARMSALLDAEAAPHFAPIAVRPGQVLSLGAVAGPGQRCYLAVSGGFAAASFLGSTATFTLGGFGGHATGALRAGDTLRLAGHATQVPAAPAAPEFGTDWVLALCAGPHAAPDFFTDRDIDTLFAATYEVHHNSARTGVRLIGPSPEWARTDGGEAGLHPSNIHDNAYAVGALNFTGDMPILLGPDGPSLGGFACPGVVARKDLWKLGQLRPGDRVRFSRADEDAAILHRGDGITIRRAGEENILIEFGDMVLDFALRLRVHALQTALRAAVIPGIVDLTPGIRSLQVHYDPDRLPRSRLLGAIKEMLPGLPSPEEIAVPSRIVHLPLSWQDPAVRLAMRKYQETVRPDAPWCPDNIEFIRRINGLASEDAVKRIVFDASYLVLGLGDVYLGAPVATPIDPRHRLVTTKYNPARTWTPENAVGIGGAYLCVYGMEGPGGYQLFGRTVQMWNSWAAPGRPGHAFAETPWLLRHFDQLRFFEVSEAELAEARAAFPHGHYPIRIEESSFSLADHERLLRSQAEGIATFRNRQRAAFAREREEWAAKGLNTFEEPDLAPAAEDAPLPAGACGVAAPVPGSVWRVLVGPGDPIKAGDPVLIVESMKMEVSVAAPISGVVTHVGAVPGQVVRAGERVAVIEMRSAA